MQALPSRRQRGIALLEALIAFLVLSLGMLAIVRVQTHLRLNADIARQRSEAVRLAQEDIESMRAFAVVAAAPGLRSFEAIASESRTVDPAGGHPTNTAYRINREIDAPGALQARSLRVTVGWNDRGGELQQVTLDSVIAGIAPAYSGALGLARRAGTARGAHARSVRIPIDAKEIGDGRSAFKPAAGGSIAYVFDNASGMVTGRCAGVAPTAPNSALTSANLGACDANVGLVLSGIVRFSSASPPDASLASEVPLPFTIAMAMSGGAYARAPSCSVEPVTTPGGDRFAAYFCVVYPSTGGRWSGRATIEPVGWTIGTGDADRRICRYTSDLDGSGAIDANLEHPSAYAGVDTSLPNQNFLVVGGRQTCPAGHAAPIAGNNGGVNADLNTAQHQP